MKTEAEIREGIARLEETPGYKYGSYEEMAGMEVALRWALGEHDCLDREFPERKPGEKVGW